MLLIDGFTLAYYLLLVDSRLGGPISFNSCLGSLLHAELHQKVRVGYVLTSYSLSRLLGCWVLLLVLLSEHLLLDVGQSCGL